MGQKIGIILVIPRLVQRHSDFNAKIVISTLKIKANIDQLQSSTYA